MNSAKQLASPDTRESAANPLNHSQLAAALAEYVELQEGGQPPSRAEFVARFPEVATELDECLRQMDWIGQMAGELSEDLLAGGSAAGNEDEANRPDRVLGDFRILREVGRGGMGIVYEAEQISLRRRVALKILPSAAMLDPRALQRFRNEAQAAASLHHGQIVPIYGVGCERGVHYYAMQFIDGLTLADVIVALRESAGLEPRHQPDASQPDAPARDTSATVGRDSNPVQKNGEADGIGIPSYKEPAPKSATETDVLAALSTEKSRTSPAWFRRIAEQFAQVADALHHAHELGVTHRDIKPANLMLDRLGHIWITDFGLARIEGEGNLTMTGDLVGTLRYMSPEQALAKRIGIDHRTDIYSLGITLYEILTLHPALSGQGRQELLRQIAFEEPKLPRKHNPAIPRDLETILLKATQKNPTERYQTAADLAADLKRFFDDRHIEARRPSLYVRASRWVKRRRGLVAATAIILFLATACSLGWAIDHSRRVSKATALVNDALQETALRRVEAQAKRDDLVAWEQAASSAQRAKALAESGFVNHLIESKIRHLAAQVEEEHKLARTQVATAKRNAQMIRDLMNVRMDSTTKVEADQFDASGVDAAYRQAFLDYGIDFTKANPAEITKQIRASEIREILVNSLIDWASHVKSMRPSLLSLAEAAAAESPAWHKPLLNAIRTDDLTAMQKLAETVQSDLPPEGAACVGLALRGRNDFKSALALYKAAAHRHPGDFWLNEELGLLLDQQTPHSAESIRFLTSAVAIRPDSPGARYNLGILLNEEGRYEEGILMLQEAVRLKPNYASAYLSLGIAYWKQGKPGEATLANRQAILLEPTLAQAHLNLGVALWSQQKLDEAVEAYREAVRLEPDNARAQSNFGAGLAEQGKLDDAVAAFREGIRLQPTHADAHSNLAMALASQGNFEKALTAFREALRIEPNSPRVPYYAARAALLIAAGKGKEADKLEDAERARLRHQALVWLRDDLTVWGKLAESSQPQQLPQDLQALVHWQQDRDLASLRDERQVQQLPAEDQDLCRQLWGDHAELVKNLQARLKAENK